MRLSPIALRAEEQHACSSLSRPWREPARKRACSRIGDMVQISRAHSVGTAYYHAKNDLAVNMGIAENNPLPNGIPRCHRACSPARRSTPSGLSACLRGTATSFSKDAWQVNDRAESPPHA